jgi:hypothetical protein
MRRSSAEEYAQVQDLNRQMRELYQPAWDRAMSLLKDSREQGAPWRSIQDQEKGLPPGTLNARQAAPPPGSGTIATGASFTSYN